MSIETLGATPFDEPFASSNEPKQHATREALPIGHLDTMPGNALLALAGVKTLYVGHPPEITPQAGQFVWLTSTVKINEDGDSKTIRVPVIIDNVGELATRSKLTPEQYIAAGYRDDANMRWRVKKSPNYEARTLRKIGGLDLDTSEVDSLYYDTAPSSRITFHVATPDELKSPYIISPTVQEAHAAITDSFSALKVGKDLGRSSVLEAIDFAENQGVDLVKAKLALQTQYSNARGGRATNAA